MRQTKEDQEYSVYEELLRYCYAQRSNAFWSGVLLGFLAGTICGFLLVIMR